MLLDKHSFSGSQNASLSLLGKTKVESDTRMENWRAPCWRRAILSHGKVRWGGGQFISSPYCNPSFTQTPICCWMEREGGKRNVHKAASSPDRPHSIRHVL